MLIRTANFTCKAQHLFGVVVIFALSTSNHKTGEATL